MVGRRTGTGRPQGLLGTPGRLERPCQRQDGRQNPRQSGSAPSSGAPGRESRRPYRGNQAPQIP